MTSRPERGLVLGGGGVSGIAWEVGVLWGLAEAGVDLTTADTILGSSAGSVVGALLGTGVPLEEVYAAQFEAESAAANAGTEPPPPGSEVGVISKRTIARVLLAQAGPLGSPRAMKMLGRWAHKPFHRPPSDLRAVFAERLPVHTWPEHPRIIATAIDTRTGALHLLDKDSGAELVDAVTASCSVPGVWPPVRIKGADYMDGGLRNAVNADLIGDHDRVVIIAPQPRSIRRSSHAVVQAKKLGPDVRTAVVIPDRAGMAAMGRNLLDPGNAAAAARAGRAQGAEAAARVRAVWTDQG